MKPLASLALEVRGLRAEAENLRAELPKLRIVVTEATRLQSAAWCAGNGQPRGRQRHAGPTRQRISVKNSESGALGKIDGCAGSGEQNNIGKTLADQMAASFIVLGNGEIIGKL